MKKDRGKSTIGIVCLLLVCACTAETSIEPRQVLTEAQDALRATESVEYRFTSTPVAGSPEPAMNGRATIQRLDLSGSGFLVQIDAEVQPQQGQTYPFKAVKQAEHLEVLDGEQRVHFSASPYSGGGSLVSRMYPALMYPFFDPESLTDEIGATAVTWEGGEDIAGVACDCVRVAYEDDEEDSRWCFGRQDRLPRSLEWISPEGRSSLRLEDLTFPREPEFSRIEPPPGFRAEQVTIGPAPGSPAKPWILAGPDGKEVSLEELQGQVVVLDFWATWCPPCHAELIALDSLVQEFPPGTVVAFAVNAMESLEPGDPEAFVAELGISLEVLLDGDEVHRQYAPGNLPALAVINPRGRVTGVTTGYLGEGSIRHIRSLIEQALAEN